MMRELFLVLAASSLVVSTVQVLSVRVCMHSSFYSFLRSFVVARRRGRDTQTQKRLFFFKKTGPWKKLPGACSDRHVDPPLGNTLWYSWFSSLLSCSPTPTYFMLSSISLSYTMHACIRMLPRLEYLFPFFECIDQYSYTKLFRDISIINIFL
jgi:hypothetical protein